VRDGFDADIGLHGRNVRGLGRSRRGGFRCGPIGTSTIRIIGLPSTATTREH
jgi:hypothetical protein